MLRSQLSSFLEISVASLTFLFLAIYGYALLFEVPYLGFIVDSNNTLTVLHTGLNPPEALQSSDTLSQVNGFDWDTFSGDIHGVIYFELTQGADLNLLILRENRPLQIPWIVPGINLEEFFYRLLSAWWLPYAFWLAGMVTFLLVRPKNTRWQLLSIFFFLIALGLSAGVLSLYRLFYSQVFLRSAIWLILPVSWHLHRVFPKPLEPSSKRFLWFLYVMGSVLVLAEWFNLLPTQAYLVGFVLILINSLTLLVIHAIAQPDQRRGVVFLLTTITLTILPTLVAVIGALLFNSFPRFVNVSVLILPIIPFAYIYTINRGWVDGMELRANRLITVIIYSGLLLAVTIVLTFISTAIFPTPSYHLSIGIALTFLLSLGTVYAYPVFQRWIERSLLGIPLPPTQLLERYTARITTSLGSEELIRLLRNDVFPSLLVRQAALLRLDAGQTPVPIFLSGVRPELLPDAEQLPTLLAQAGAFPRSRDTSYPETCPWALLVLPMSIRGQVIGVCLLGKRDPDDSYSRAEISTLQALLDQTALAMVNIEQAERLRALYQNDIERQEMERSHLARELHDDVLNQLGILWMSVDERQAGEQFAEAYQTSVHRIREIISGLRPGMLMYGLRFALEELTEETATQVGGEIAIKLDVPSSDVRYPPDVELHVFRIVQQACQNALKHSRAQGIFIRGQLDPGKLELLVEDDGIGFTAGENLDLPRLLVNRHFGLAGMHERAALIGAEMLITSAPGNGTRVQVTWKTEPAVVPGSP